MKIFCIIICLLIFALSQQVVYAQQSPATGPKKESAEDFVKLEMPLEEAFTKITFVVTWLSGEGNSEVIFEGEGVTHYPDRIVLTEKHEIYGRTSYSSYTIFPQDTVESNRYIFVPLADWGGGSGVFFDLNVVDKKTLRTVDDIGLGDRARVRDVVLADAHSDTVTITYIRREVKKGEPAHDPKKAIKKHFRMIGGILQEVENPLIPSDPDIVLTHDPKIEVPDRTQIVLSPSDPNMVLVPAGEFQMGSNDKASDGEKWVHTVYVDAFYMDVYEVTNAQYKMFVDANPQWEKDHTPWKYHDGNYLKDWNGNNYPIGKGDHPVANVSWYGARAYAKWVGKRLPTQAEWEKAARGGLTGQRYPWGNSIDFSNANHARNVGGTTPVGSYPPNRYGLYDMVGNVWEWCLDELDRDFYKTSPGRNPIAGADSVTDIINGFFNRKSWRVLRGGSWIRFARDVSVSDIDYGPPNFSHDDFGFRCVNDVTPDLEKHGDLSPLRTPPRQKEQERGPNKVSVSSDHTIPEDMALIPAGEFQMGSNDGDDDEKPESPATEPKKEPTEGFVKLEMPLEEAFTKITFMYPSLKSGDLLGAIVFEGEGVTREKDYMRLQKRHDLGYRETYSYYTLLSKYAVESNRYIFVPLAQSGGSGVFWDLNVVDKKTLKSVDSVGLGDRSSVKEVVLADAASNTVSITYMRREVRKGEVVYDPPSKQHFRMIEGILREVENPLSPFDPDTMFIPAGEFGMGSNDKDAEDDEKPRRNVYVDAFRIDRYEVTNAQYKKFIDANPQWQKNRIPEKYHDGDYLKHWNGNNYPPDKGKHPVVYVSWYAAMAYAEWRGKRLPTEAEWEKAARGNRYGRDYAWGDSLDPSKANYGEEIGDTTPVGTYDMNGYGLYDMTGNVWEWCLDEYDADFYSISPPRNPLSGRVVNNILSNFTNIRSARVLRGGSWVSNAKFVRVSDRTRFTPQITNKARGFRCVKSVTP